MSFHFSSDETWLLRQELFGALENVAFIALHINLNKVHLVLDKFELMHLLVEHLDIKLPTRRIRRPRRRQGGARQGREGFGSQQQQQQAQQLQSFYSEQNPEGTSSFGAACFWRSFRPSVAWCFGVARGTLWRPATPAPAAPPAAAAPGNRRKR